MGKVRSLRARVHQVAVRPTGEAAPAREVAPLQASIGGIAGKARSKRLTCSAFGALRGRTRNLPSRLVEICAEKELACVNANVFAGTTIEPSALVQKLDVETRSVTSVRRGAEAKTILPKKEKLKLRRERWLQKIEAIKLAEQKRKAERRRRATVVVGDLQPLRDALPELLQLEAGSRRPPTRRVASRPRPAELSRMSAVQRLQLLEEERTRFQELLASPAYRASPLLVIGRQLAEQMQLEGGGQP